VKQQTRANLNLILVIIQNQQHDEVADVVGDMVHDGFDGSVPE